ncbi:MAG: hypothetical protein M3452_06080, partial [Chloroflexota bacterium]|nr:hypothetical protein [Chloroflexota bacterium]
MSDPVTPFEPRLRADEQDDPDTVRSPREGWTSLALLMIMLVTMAVAVDDANWAGFGPSDGR